MEIIDYNPKMVVKNLDAMPRGVGARYLEILIAHNGDYVAYAWRRKIPAEIRYNHAIIDTGYSGSKR